MDPLIPQLSKLCKISKKEGKDQESIQSSTTPDPGYQWESNNVTITHHKREPRGLLCGTLSNVFAKSICDQICLFVSTIHSPSLHADDAVHKLLSRVQRFYCNGCFSYEGRTLVKLYAREYAQTGTNWVSQDL